jgi:nucleotide-binding universal stress UspA family protein
VNPNNPPVVVGVDHITRPISTAALQFAANEALARGTGIRVVHGCVVDLDLSSPDGAPRPQDRACRREQPADAAAETLRQLTEREVPITVDTPLLTGEEALVRASASACLVVVQRQSGNAFGRLVAGSTASTVAAQAACPVVVVHSDDRVVQEGAVVVGVDDRGHGQQALATAAIEAGWRRLPLVAVQSWVAAVDRPPYVGYVPTDDDPIVRTARHNAERSLAEAVAGLQEMHPDVEIHHRLLHGEPVECLLAASRNAILLVVARHSSPRLATLGLGHVARALISQAHCPVMVTAPSRPSKEHALAADSTAGH